MTDQEMYELLKDAQGDIARVLLALRSRLSERPNRMTDAVRDQSEHLYESVDDIWSELETAVILLDDLITGGE